MPPRFGGGFFRTLTLAFCLTSIPAVIATGALLTGTAREHLVHELSAGLFTQLRLIRSQADPSAFSMRCGQGPRTACENPFHALAARLGSASARRITFISSEGVVLGDSSLSAQELARVENHGERPEVWAALQGREGSASRRSGTLGVDFLYAAVPVEREGRVAGVVRAAVSLEEIERKVKELRRGTVWITLCAALLALAAALLLSRSLAAPVLAMCAAADKMAAGDLGARVRSCSQDEHGRLGRTLDLLAEKAQSTIAALSHEKAQLTMILSTMVEAVVAVDSRKSILTVNEAFARLAGLPAEQAAGKAFGEALRNDELSALLERVLEKGERATRELTLFSPEELVFEANALPIREGGKTAGALGVLHDITRLRRLEQLRKEFVANVSHELRTPLASIQGSAETLLGGAMEKPGPRREFTQAIKEDADRLSLLVEDLLDLSAIESGRQPPKLDSLSPADIARETAEKLAPAAARRKVRIEINGAGVPPALADAEQVRQVFTNLLDNAIKFNREGGSVSVSFAAEGAFLRVEVQDTGAGIPAPDLPRVFERFYRVDKARSRELGGTGLGLSIVKHIVEAHGGSVSVESVEGRGSSFRFTLPL